MRKIEQIIIIKCIKKSNAHVFFVEKNEAGFWEIIFKTKGYIGKNGMGKEEEGDNKTPIGRYQLGTAFGIKENPGTSIHYIKVKKNHYWCDDQNSPFYNKLIETNHEEKETYVGEHLIDYKEEYQYGIFIEYNKQQKKGKGSCIFLHCIGEKKYTSGCVAIPESMMRKFLIRLNEGAEIVLF